MSKVIMKIERVDSMINTADRLLNSVRGASDISDDAELIADHLEHVLGDLNFMRVQLFETSGPIVTKK